jgi:DNA polymerase-3 subunit gamma/tau
MRDALTLFEQVSSYALNDRITVETVERALGLAPIGTVEEYLRALMDGDPRQASEIVDRVYEEGYDIEQFIQICLEQVEEKITVHPSTEMIALARDLMNLTSEMRFFENKKMACKLLSMDIAAKRGTKAQPTQPAQEQTKNVERAEQKSEAVNVQSKPTDQIDISALLDYLREQGDMAMYVALVQAKIAKRDGTVEVSFLPSQRFQYEYLREKLFELEYLFKTQLKLNVTVELKVDEEREKQLLEKLQRMFPGRIKIEE